MKKFALLLLCFFAINGFAHKYYVSISNMEWDEKEQSINVSLKATDHDFLHLLEMTFQERLDLEMISDTSKYARFIEKYMAEKITLMSGSKQTKMDFLGFEVTDRLYIYFYIIFKEVEDPKEIEVSNKFLFESFSEQQNIVHYKYEDSTKSVTLVPSQPKGRIRFY